MVVVDGEGILRGLPVPISVPPQLPVNHRRIRPDPPVAERLIFPASFQQKPVLSDETEVGAVGAVSTVIVTYDVGNDSLTTP